MSDEEFDLESCLCLLGLEVQRQGELVIWFSAGLQSGTRRWAAIYKYQGSYYGQATDVGQSSPSKELSGPFGVLIYDVEIDSLEIGGLSIPAKSFIQLLRKELKYARYKIPGLDVSGIKALAKKMPPITETEERNLKSYPAFDEFLKQQEFARANGSIFKLWEDEDSDEWKAKFDDLLSQNGDCVYSLYWDSGGPGAGAGSETIEYFLGKYWARISWEGLAGPYRTFEGIFDNENLPFRFITSATEKIWCSELTAEELVPKLIFDEDSLDRAFTIEINDQTYGLSEDFHLIPFPSEGESDR